MDLNLIIFYLLYFDYRVFVSGVLNMIASQKLFIYLQVVKYCFLVKTNILYALF